MEVTVHAKTGFYKQRVDQIIATTLGSEVQSISWALIFRQSSAEHPKRQLSLASCGS